MPFFEVSENCSFHLYNIGCLSMIYRLKYAKSESNFDADFEHPTCKGKSFKTPGAICKAFALTGRIADCLYTQGVALG